MAPQEMSRISYRANKAFEAAVRTQAALSKIRRDPLGSVHLDPDLLALCQEADSLAVAAHNVSIRAGLIQQRLFGLTPAS